MTNQLRIHEMWQIKLCNSTTKWNDFCKDVKVCPQCCRKLNPHKAKIKGKVFYTCSNKKCNFKGFLLNPHHKYYKGAIVVGDSYGWLNYCEKHKICSRCFRKLKITRDDDGKLYLRCPNEKCSNSSFHPYEKQTFIFR